MSRKVRIQNPCHEDWDKMTPQKEGRLCAACRTTVVDFSNKSLEEIKLYFEKNAGKKYCGHYRAHHTADKTWYSILNSIESFFTSIKLTRLALGLITVLLFVSGCQRKHIRGKLRIDKSKNAGRIEQKNAIR